MSNVEESYCQVAVKYPGKESILTYKTKGEKLLPGTLVEVPLGRRKTGGVVTEFHLSVDDIKKIESEYKLREIVDVVAPEFHLSKLEMELYTWISKYYHYNLGMLVWDCLPKILKRPREVSLEFGNDKDFEFELNEFQKPIVESIKNKLGQFDRFFVHGVTGSGKTLVYLNLIKEVINSGKSVLFLLPEINLTPQFTQTFKEYLNCPILPYHSGVSASHKNAVWKFLKKSERPVLVMGVRSSVFLPTENLGLVIVDEEHDGSFKQSDRCSYNGRDVAIKKAQLSNCPVILGSATPSLENYYQFTRNKRDHYFTMEKRASGHLPKIELLDCRKQGDRKDEDQFLWPFEKSALDEIENSLSKNEQVLVFVNRLGFSNYLQCRSCGYKFVDPNTEVPLRYFKNKNILSSAHSDYQIPVPEMCPDCGNLNLLQMGFGTERLQEVLKEYFPGKRIERFDRDEITNLEKLENRLEEFHRGDIDILVGTQMLSKGHNFKRVNLVLILGIDSMLSFPDFRSMEKTYQMLVQILGRAGRYSDEARVVIQTLLPENPLFSFVKDHSFNGFLEFELGPREIGGFPPYRKMVGVHISGRNREKLVTEIMKEVDNLNHVIGKNSLEVEVWGPSPAMIERRANMYTWSFFLISKNVNQMHFVIDTFKKFNQIEKNYSVKIDVDPLLMG